MNAKQAERGIDGIYESAGSYSRFLSRGGDTVKLVCI